MGNMEDKRCKVKLSSDVDSGALITPDDRPKSGRSLRDDLCWPSGVCGSIRQMDSHARGRSYTF